MGDRLPPDALHAMNPTGRFSDRASDYVKYRPTYPTAAIDAVLRGLGDPADLIAADVGAGTGILSRLLGDRGVRVIAIEPNLAMREATAAHPRVEWRAGTAEATGLLATSADLVVVAQAFHWFRQREAIAEFHRVLVPAGRLVVMWNSRDGRDPVTHDFIQAIHAVNGEHPAERRGIEPGAIEGDGLFTAPVFETFEHAQELDDEGFVGRATSASYVPREGEAFERLRALLLAAHARHCDERGIVRFRYVTKVYLAARL